MAEQNDIERIVAELTQSSSALSKDLRPRLADPDCVAAVGKLLDNRWRKAKSTAAAQRLAGTGSEGSGTELLQRAKEMMRTDLGLADS